jgi:hypothetical protein
MFRLLCEEGGSLLHGGNILNKSLYLSFIWTSTGILIETPILVTRLASNSALVEIEHDVDKFLDWRQTKWGKFYLVNGGKCL